jgi:hypothetical protein
VKGYSWQAVARSGFLFLVFGFFSNYIIRFFLDEGCCKHARHKKFKVAFFGGSFVLSGFFIQFAGALFDLIEYNG